MKHLRLLVILMTVLGLLAGCATTPQQSAQPTPQAQTSGPVEIEFWFVPFSLWEDGYKAVVAEFEKNNPDIKVKLVPVQYEEITQKVAATVPVGQGPDIIVPYYGWVPQWVQNGFLAPLPEDAFPPSQIREDFVAAQDVSMIDGKYYGIPQDMGVWALFYNKDAFAEADIAEPPTTWEELRETAIKLTKRDENGNLVRAGYFIDFGQQEHIVWKILIEQWGQPMFDAENRHVQWAASETGYEAWQWFLNLLLVDKVSEWGWAEAASVAFYQGISAMNIGHPGWFARIRDNNPDLNYGVAPFVCGPAEDEALACRNLAQFWSYTLTTKAAQDPVKGPAAVRFLQFLASPEGYDLFLDIRGGLPPLKSMLESPKYADNPLYQPFIARMPYSKAIPWVDELAERDISIQMGERVMLNNEDPRAVLEWGAEQNNKLRDDFFAKGQQ